jgi:hypothetical protein
MPPDAADRARRADAQGRGLPLQSAGRELFGQRRRAAEGLRTCLRGCGIAPGWFLAGGESDVAAFGKFPIAVIDCRTGANLTLDLLRDFSSLGVFVEAGLHSSQQLIRQIHLVPAGRLHQAVVHWLIENQTKIHRLAVIDCRPGANLTLDLPRDFSSLGVFVEAGLHSGQQLIRQIHLVPAGRLHQAVVHWLIEDQTKMYLFLVIRPASSRFRCHIRRGLQIDTDRCNCLANNGR